MVYVAAEDPDGCRARLKAFRKTKGLRASQEGRRLPLKLVPQAVNLLEPDDVDNFIRDSFDVAAGWDVPLGVVCFDTFSVCIGGADENNSSEMSRALEALYRISKEFDCLVVVVAHFGKSGTTGGIRGWSGLAYNADGVIVIERDEEDPDPCRSIPDTNARRTDLRIERVAIGPVVYVGDGDGLCVAATPSRERDPTTWVEIRLADFYAPELSEPGGQAAKAALARVVNRQRVACVGAYLSYDRLVARSHINGISVGDLMRRAGVKEGGNSR